MAPLSLHRRRFRALAGDRDERLRELRAELFVVGDVRPRAESLVGQPAIALAARAEHAAHDPTASIDWID